MDKQKSNVISLKTRKPLVSEHKSPEFKNLKSDNRINHVPDACGKSGHYSRVPNCIYEMGLSSQEREIWLYFNRLPLWEHPRVDEIHKSIGIRKSSVLSCIQSLCDLNMLVIDGEGKNRRFHIPHPLYWKHEIPRTQYKIDAGDMAPMDITSGVFAGTLKKRSGRNVPGGTKKNVPGGTKKRSGRNEKTTKNVPGGTKNSQQSPEPLGVEAPCKTSLKDLTRLSNTGGTGQTSLPGAELGVSLDELIGAMLSLYSLTSPKVIEAVIRSMVRKATSRDHVLAIIEAKRKEQQGLMRWDVSHTDKWLSTLAEQNSEPAKAKPSPADPVYEDLDSVPFPNDCPF